MAVNLPTSADVQKLREQTAEQAEVVRTPLLAVLGAGDFAVTDDDKHYVGLVTSEDLKAALVYREAIPLLQVNELQRSNLPTLAMDEPLDLVLEKFSRCDSDALVVLDDDDHRRILGLVTRSQLMRRYQSALDLDE